MHRNLLVRANTLPCMQQCLLKSRFKGWGATISAPHMHAYCMELLRDKILAKDARCLDVGSGLFFVVPFGCVLSTVYVGSQH
jgi:hypothetical protein